MTSPLTADPAQIAALWATLRVIVIDVETVMADDGHHVIEVAAVTCRNAQRTSRTWSARVNPGVPVDAASHRIHGISDADLVAEHPFASIADELSVRLRGLDGETVVLAGHQIAYDVAVLRREYQRIDQDLADLPLLDTRLLTRTAGATPDRDSLASLLTTLNLTNPAAHTAAGDAQATADALIALLDRSAAAGLTDFAELHARVMGNRRRVSDIKPTAPKRARTGPDPVEDTDQLPAAHTDGHTTILEAPEGLPQWLEQLAECAALRCPYARDRVTAATADPGVVREHIEALLDQVLTTQPVDVPAVATILGALAPLLEQFPDRRTALAWHDRWQPRLFPLGRCPQDGPTVACPGCRSGEACPLDTWYEHLAVSARQPVSTQSRKSFLNTQGAHAGSGVLTTWLKTKANRQFLAEATARLVYDEHRAAGQLETAEMFARYAFQAGTRDPLLTAAYANLLASPGNLEALTRAIDVCTQSLDTRAGNTDDAWRLLAAKRSQLRGRAARLRDRPSGQIDADGNPIPKRRHHPTNPRRTRAPRFTAG
ncbi:3'-5' exonuclease [Isoptericola sp. b490]|uniref:3'-5' exonuclease n=1 Tax=Actinotalea lenta TaxID=3064654 RepID=UPI002712EBDF|nr:3'-5' exonuclease [Isoptericola sp. b490]MDO8120339.1 3'-5' exonuclease [Isoptericola sp. b490]